MADGRSRSRIRGRNARRLAGAALLTGPMLQPSYKSVRALAEARLVRRQRAALLASLARPQPPLQPLRFYFLLPAFRAVEDVEGAYEWFRHLTVPEEVRATIVFITTDRDGPLDDNETAGAVRRLLAAVGEDAPILHIHSRRQPYSKASQLNEAVAQLPVEGPEATYYLVFDIDGRPERRAVEMTARLLADDRPVLAQQLAVTVGRPVGGTTALARVDALTHLCRAFHHEYRRWRRTSGLRRRGTVAAAVVNPCVYCVGNGLVVEAAALGRLGGFPEPVDDLGVGFRASYLGLPIVPLPVYVHQAMYRDVPHMTSSKRFIYGGIISAFRELPHGLSGIGGARVLAAKGMLPALTWVSLPAALVLGAVVQPCSLRRRAELLAAVSLLASLPPAVAGSVIKRGIEATTGPSPALPAQERVSAGDIALAPVELFVNAAGPCSYLWRRLVHRSRASA